MTLADLAGSRSAVDSPASPQLFAGGEPVATDAENLDQRLCFVLVDVERDRPPGA